MRGVAPSAAVPADPHSLDDRLRQSAPRFPSLCFAICLIKNTTIKVNNEQSSDILFRLSSVFLAGGSSVSGSDWTSLYKSDLCRCRRARPVRGGPSRPGLWILRLEGRGELTGEVTGDKDSVSLCTKVPIILTSSRHFSSSVKEKKNECIRARIRAAYA